MKTRPWQVWLPAILMSVTGAGWFAWAATPETLSQGWLPDWPPALIVAGGVIHFAAAWGLLQRRAWGWIVALNTASGHGPWPQGEFLLADLCRQVSASVARPEH